MRKTYQIRLINTDTKETQLTAWIYTSRKKAEAFIESWKALGKPFDAEIVVRVK